MFHSVNLPDKFVNLFLRNMSHLTQGQDWGGFLASPCKIPIKDKTHKYQFAVHERVTCGFSLKLYISKYILLVRNDMTEVIAKFINKNLRLWPIQTTPACNFLVHGRSRQRNTAINAGKGLSPWGRCEEPSEHISGRIKNPLSPTGNSTP